MYILQVYSLWKTYVACSRLLCLWSDIEVFLLTYVGHYSNRRGWKIKSITLIWTFINSHVSSSLSCLPPTIFAFPCVRVCVCLCPPTRLFPSVYDYEISPCVFELWGLIMTWNHGEARRLTSSWVRKDSCCRGVKYRPMRQFRSWEREREKPHESC